MPIDDGWSKIYLESAKKSDATFTPSPLFPPLAYKDYKELTSKYPDLDIKFYLDNAHQEYDGDMKCDLAVTQLYKYVLYSTQENLLRRTINVTELEIAIIPDHKEFTLLTILDTIAKLPLKVLVLEVGKDDDMDVFDKDEKLIIPVNREYTMTVRDYSSLQKVLSVESLRKCSLRLDCVLHVQDVYRSFIHSSNNNFNMFSFESLNSRFVKSFKSDGRYHHHLVQIASLPDFDIVEFVQKFKRTPARDYIVKDGSVEKFSEIKSSYDQFAQSRKDYRFVLRHDIAIRTSGPCFIVRCLYLQRNRFREKLF